MFSLIIFIVVIILNTVAGLQNENPQVLLNCKNSTDKKYTVDKTKPLKLIVENCNAKYVQCYNFYFKRNEDFQYPVTFTLNANSNVINITNVTDAMSTRWFCNVLEEYHGGIEREYNNHTNTVVKLFVNIHVMGAKLVNVTVNLLNLALEQAGLSAREYDGESRYYYKDGEIIDYVCHKDNIMDIIQLKYYDAKDTLIFQSDVEEATPHHFRSIMTSSNDKSYIICVLISMNPREEYRYKTTFIRRNPDSYAISESVERATVISVNGLELVPLPPRINEDKNIDNYQYKYIEGDVLNITCEKRKKIGGNMELHFPEKSRFPSGNLKSRGEIIMVSLDTSHLIIHKTVLSCGINNSNEIKIFAKILFLSDLPKKGLRVRGLPLKNVNYQFNNGRNQWIIGYQYRVNETLDLTCVYKYEHLLDNIKLQWTFDRQKINTFPQWNTDVSTQSTSKNFILLEKHNQSRIICHSFHSTSGTVDKVIVVLNLKSDDYSDSDESTDETLFMILGGSFGIIIAIITTVCLACWWTKTKQARLIQNEYENFSCQNESPIPEFPSQWENYYHDSHYSHIDENAILGNSAYSGDTKKLYAKPNTRQSKTPSENFYTEIDEYSLPKNVSLRSGRNTSNPPNNSNDGVYHECINNLYDSRKSFAGYDVLRRSNLNPCDDKEKYNNSSYAKTSQRYSKPKNSTIRQDSKVVRPECSSNSIAKCSISSNRLNKDNVNPFAEVKKDELYAQPYDVTKKGSRGEKSFQPTDKNINTILYADPHGDLTEVNCENDCYG